MGEAAGALAALAAKAAVEPHTVPWSEVAAVLAADPDRHARI
jgi:hypothetical protein